MSKGPKGERRPADLNKRAFAIVQIATGGAEDTPKKESHAKAGKAGGRSRARSLSADRRTEIAKKASSIRWRKSD